MPHPFCSGDCCIVELSALRRAWMSDVSVRSRCRRAQIPLTGGPALTPQCFPVTVILEIWNTSPVDRTKSSNLIVKKADLTKLLSNWFKHQSILHYVCLFSRDATLPRTGWGTSFSSETARIQRDADHTVVIKSKQALSQGAISGSSGRGNKIYNNVGFLKCENEKHAISLLMF